VNVADLPAGLLDDLVARARDAEPSAFGAFVFGSYARGDARPTSDLDLRVITHNSPAFPYRTWFAGQLHVSLGFNTVESLRERAALPADWSLGFAVEAPAVWVWSTDEAIAALGDPPIRRQPSDPPEVEDFVEACAKGLSSSDSIAMRTAAMSAGAYAVPLVRELNQPITVAERRDVIPAAVGFPVAPPGWSDDLLVLLGLVPAGDDDVRIAVERMARGVLRLLRESRSTVGDRQPELTGYLMDGTLERHLGRRPPVLLP
jgi:hypothetical protein